MGTTRLSYLTVFLTLIFTNRRLFFLLSSSLLVPCEFPLEHTEFVRQSDKFWTYDLASHSWQETDVSHILNTAKLSDLSQAETQGSLLEDSSSTVSIESDVTDEIGTLNLLPIRRRLSLVRISEASIWITGESGSVYERFWNGVQWVLIPHDLPTSAGHAMGILCVNLTMVALSESGMLYQLQQDANRQPFWMLSRPWLSGSNNTTLLRPGLASANGRSLYFATSDGSLAELMELQPLRWANHGRPRGGDVAVVADAGTLRPNAVFSISKLGDLYEFDSNEKPAWKKHVRESSVIENFTLYATRGAALRGLASPSCLSLFLLTMDGFLVERRYHQRKWRWISHPSPIGASFSAVGPVILNESSKEKMVSFFLTTHDGNVFEYAPRKLAGTNNFAENGIWTNHKHPLQAPVARSYAGMTLSEGRLVYILDDGRIGDLHLPGIGGEEVGPIARSGHTLGKRLQSILSTNYEWSILDAPESEGGNAGYCTLARGPSHCLEGVKGTLIWGTNSPLSVPKVFRKSNEKQHSHQSIVADEGIRMKISMAIPVSQFSWNYRNDSLFQLRTMQFGRSFFLVGNDGTMLERFYNDGSWIWLKHEHNLPVNGLLGAYNGSIFTADSDGMLLMRERVDDRLRWMNFSTSGIVKIVSGPPWDGMLGEPHMITVDDALFFVNSDGKLIELIVALRKFSWQDCGHPSTAFVAYILDQEVLRYRLVFVVGSDKHLYHFNRVTRKWQTHNQPDDIFLSRLPGAVIRPSYQSMVGSLFLRSEVGTLIEFQWSISDGWVWNDHGQPESDIILATSPGPGFYNWRLFVIASNGKVFSRYLTESRWEWEDHGHPPLEAALLGSTTVIQGKHIGKECESRKDQMSCKDEAEHMEDSIAFGQINLSLQGMDIYVSFSGECDTKVAPVRPIAFSKSSVVFMLNDGRLAELRESIEGHWNWTHIVDTPTSSCQANYWTPTVV